ncbi:mitotic spindle assembly checkpoint protein MAD2A-like [Anopheles marshallii]|uniref:mitotic spindle assembly checkpoint protein MAD2A-like n=1 Tax=Anopheles marshallii TaxID=1521116 RepID=UPI00237BC8F7|nr:mitotic spindle assembly checkpoint protein MAD2A-like [Anopheles marshallii]
MVSVQDHCITLEGSASFIHEYLKYSVHSIIYQRGIYPSEDFLPEEYNGVPMMVSRNSKIKYCIEQIMGEVKELIMKQLIFKITVCFITLDKSEIIERWDFNIKPQYENEEVSTSYKPLPKIQSEIREVMRQIISTVSFLPCLEERCTFDIILHTASNVFVKHPIMLKEYLEEDAASIEIQNAQTLYLKQFSTGFNKVDTQVVYRKAEI